MRLILASLPSSLLFFSFFETCIGYCRRKCIWGDVISITNMHESKVERWLQQHYQSSQPISWHQDFFLLWKSEKKKRKGFWKHAFWFRFLQIDLSFNSTRKQGPCNSGMLKVNVETTLVFSHKHHVSSCCELDRVSKSQTLIKYFQTLSFLFWIIISSLKKTKKQMTKFTGRLISTYFLVCVNC